MKSGSDIFFDIKSIVHLIRDEQFVPREGLLKLIGYFLAILILHLPFGLEHYFKRIPDDLLIVDDVEMGVSYIGCLREEVIEVELLIIGAEV